MPRVVFLLVPQVHLLDVAGPAQVFSTAADFGFEYTLSYVSQDQDVATVQGLPAAAARPSSSARCCDTAPTSTRPCI